ncbi:MAG: hypothetical protein IMW89_21860 [Ktedonobacteraceae bacterium]|nr:hypothetical protein [Ktedonobacteraceae bacterium]
MRISSIWDAMKRFCCVLLLGSMLLLAACGGNTPSPESQPGGSPSQPGYSLISLFEQEIQGWLLP